MSDYKDTLNLPKTSFPMKANLPHREPEMLKKWQEANPPEPQPEAPGQPQGGPAGAQAGDPTGAGGGTIGTGSVPTPGEPGFSANTGQGAA